MLHKLIGQSKLFPEVNVCVIMWPCNGLAICWDCSPILPNSRDRLQQSCDPQKGLSRFRKWMGRHLWRCKFVLCCCLFDPQVTLSFEKMLLCCETWVSAIIVPFILSMPPQGQELLSHYFVSCFFFCYKIWEPQVADWWWYFMNWPLCVCPLLSCLWWFFLISTFSSCYL